MEVIDLESICEKIQTAEKKHKLFEIKLFNKIPIWAYLRPNVAEFMYVKFKLTEKVEPERNFTVKKILNTIINGFKSFILFFQKRKSKFWFFETSRRINKKEPYCQYIYEEISKTNYTKLCYSEKWKYDSDIVYLNFSKLLIFSLSIILSPFFSLFINKKNRKILNSAINDILGDVGFSFRQKYIECMLWYFYFSLAYKISKPKKVFIVSNSFFIPLIAVCDNYNVETLEIQHGIMSKYSLNYNFEGLDRKWFFPKKVLLLGKEWSFMKKYFPHGVKTLVLGSSNHSINKNKNLKRNGVLFISQKPIRKFLISYMNKNKTIFSKFKLILKLHPMEFSFKNSVANDIDKDLLKNLTIISDEESLRFLQQNVKVQIGAYSTGVIEGIQMKLPTLLVDSPLSCHLHFLNSDNIKTCKISKIELRDFLKSDLTNDCFQFFSKYNKKVINEIITI